MQDYSVLGVGSCCYLPLEYPPLCVSALIVLHNYVNGLHCGCQGVGFIRIMPQVWSTISCSTGQRFFFSRTRGRALMLTQASDIARKG